MSQVTDQTNQVPLQVVVFGVGRRRFASPIDRVLEMTPLGTTDPIAGGAPSWIIGMMRLRERILPVLDLRIRLEMRSLEEERAELSDLIQASKQEHIETMTALERACTAQDRIDTAVDAEACSYSEWRKNLFLEDSMLTHMIGKLDEPHAQLHEVAVSCQKLLAAGDYNTCSNAIHECRAHQLAELTSQHEAIERHLLEQTRKMALILRADKRAVCVVVDWVESVLTYSQQQSHRPPLDEFTESAGFVTNVIKTESDMRLIQVLDVDLLFDEATLNNVTDG